MVEIVKLKKQKRPTGLQRRCSVEDCVHVHGRVPLQHLQILGEIPLHKTLSRPLAHCLREGVCRASPAVGTSSSSSRTLMSMAQQRRSRQSERPALSLNSVSQRRTLSGKENSWVSSRVIQRKA